MTAVEFATRLPKEPITWLDAARDCDLLLIDDLGKARLTYQDHEATRATECMFDLVDYRGKNHLPMIITTQLEDQELIAKWGENGVAFVRRLLEFCDIVAFPRR
jgi:DNA replication protein DnaC